MAEKKLIIQKIGELHWSSRRSVAASVPLRKPSAQHCLPILSAAVDCIHCKVAPVPFISLTSIVHWYVWAHAKSQSIITDYYVYATLFRNHTTNNMNAVPPPLQTLQPNEEINFARTTIKIVILLHNNWVCKRMYHFMRFARVPLHILILRLLLLLLLRLRRHRHSICFRCCGSVRRRCSHWRNICAPTSARSRSGYSILIEKFVNYVFAFIFRHIQI